MQHQVAAVIVAMTEHARFRRQLLDDHRPFVAQRGALRRGQRDAAIAFDEIADEILELPGELLDVERHPVGQVRVGCELGAPPLEQLDERDRLPVERGVLGRRRRPQMRLQRDVAQVLQRHDPERVCVSEDVGHRQRHLLQQDGHVGEGQRRELDRSGVQRQHDRRTVGGNDAEVLSIRRVAGERHDPCVAARAAGAQVLVDPVADLRALGGSLVKHGLR